MEDTSLSLIDPFENVSPPNSNTQAENALNGDTNLNTNTLSVGSGNVVFHVNQQGIWLGANQFANAPFSVTMSGVITSKSTVSSTFIQIDGGNARIVGNDGTNNRLVIGNV